MPRMNKGIIKHQRDGFQVPRPEKSTLFWTKNTAQPITTKFGPPKTIEKASLKFQVPIPYLQILTQAIK